MLLFWKTSHYCLDLFLVMVLGDLKLALFSDMIMFKSDAILRHTPLVMGTIWSLFGSVYTALVEMMSHAFIL